MYVCIMIMIAIGLINTHIHKKLLSNNQTINKKTKFN